MAKTNDERVIYALANAEYDTTVYSDGSTYDPRNGYQSNGAPIRGKDDPAPQVVKRRSLFRPGYLITYAIPTTLILAFVVLVGFGAFMSFQKANWAQTVRDDINSTGVVEVLSFEDKGDAVVLVERASGDHFKCDVSYAKSGDERLGLVFCTPGSPATFTVNL